MLVKIQDEAIHGTNTERWMETSNLAHVEFSGVKAHCHFVGGEVVTFSLWGSSARDARREFLKKIGADPDRP